MGGTADEEHTFVVDGRRWRRSDPGIPETLRAELVAELMDARRAVGAAGRRGDGPAQQAARNRVNDAKVALGERGAAWWEEPSTDERAARIVATARALLRHRAPGTICPSDVARVIGGEAWRTQLSAVRSATLAAGDQLEVRQRGEPVTDPKSVRGPIRLALRPEGGPSTGGRGAGARRDRPSGRR